MRLSALSPFGPIFGKELRVTARRKRTYLLRVAYLGLLLLFMSLVYAGSRSWTYGSKLWVSQQQAALGRNFFICFSMFCVIAMALLGPVLTATAVNSERLGKTLSVLLMTPINAWQIVAGKLFSRLLIALSLIGLSLPVLALVRLLGGVEISQMLIVLGLCITQAIFGAAIGLLFSTFMNRAYAVILLAYGVLILQYLILPMLLIFGAINNTGPGGGTRSVLLFTIFNPIANCGFIAAGEGRMMGFVQWDWCIGMHLLMSAVLLVLSAWILRRRERHMPTGGMAPAELPIQEETAPDGKEIIRIKTHHVSDNPVLWRETRRPLMARRWQAIVGTIFTLYLLFYSYWILSRDLHHRDTHIGYAIIFNGLAWLLVAVLGATSIATEIESDTWTLLLTTPLTARQIVWGKILGLSRRVLWPFLLVVLHFLIFTITGVLTWIQFLLVLWIIVACNAIWVATGTYLSLRCKKVTFAVVVNLLLAVGAYFLVFIILATIDEFVRLPNRPSSHFAERMVWYLPYYHLGEVVNSLHGNLSQTLQMPDRTMITRSFYAECVAAVGIGYLILSWLIVNFTVRRFDRIVGRAPAGCVNVAGRGGR